MHLVLCTTPKINSCTWWTPAASQCQLVLQKFQTFISKVCIRSRIRRETIHRSICFVLASFPAFIWREFPLEKAQVQDAFYLRRLENTGSKVERFGIWCAWNPGQNGLRWVSFSIFDVLLFYFFVFKYLARWPSFWKFERRVFTRKINRVLFFKFFPSNQSFDILCFDESFEMKEISFSTR